MRKFAWTLSLLPSLTMASSAMVTQPGPLLTAGPVTSTLSGMSTRYNPAAGSHVIAEDDNFRWGYVSNFGFQAEIGDINNFDTEVESLIDALDEDTDVDETPTETRDRYNAIRSDLSEEGYVRFQVDLTVPVAPFSFRSDSLDGTFTVDARASGSGRLQFLDDDLNLNPVTQELETNSAVYIKGAEVMTVSLGYSTEISDNEWFKNATQDFEIPGRIDVGASLAYHHIALSKQTIALTAIDGDDELGDIISDNYEDNQTTSSNIGLDLGLVWSNENYRAGIAFRNLNEPEFDYGTIGRNCNDLTGTAEANCRTAEQFGDRIALSETFTLNSQTAIDAAWFNKSKTLTLHGGFELNSVYDPLGDEYQWASFGASYQNSWFGGRLGMSKNLAGSELTYLNAGLTLGALTFDVRSSLDNVDFDGSSSPRSVAFNIGLESRF